MKRAKLIFPAIFVLALASSAFTQRASSHARRDVTVYYSDDLQHTCNPYVTTDGQCLKDYAGYICEVYVEEIGSSTMVWQQDSMGMNCFQPYYSYVDAP